MAKAIVAAVYKKLENYTLKNILKLLLCLSIVSMLWLGFVFFQYVELNAITIANLKADFNSEFLNYQNYKESSFIAEMPTSLSESRTALQHLQDSINIQSTEKNAHPLDNCSPTQQIKLYHNQTSNGWYIQSMDFLNREKTVGGDEFYITYTEKTSTSVKAQQDEVEPTAVAFVRDLNNGKYLLDFVMTPMTQEKKPSLLKGGVGRIVVHFEYTCGIGGLSQPTKQNWKSAGMMYLKSYYSDFDIRRPPIREFKLPSPSIDLSKYSEVKFFGDSTMYQLVVKELVEKADKRGHEKSYFRKHVEYVRNVRSELTTETVNSTFMKKLQIFHGKALRNEKNLALVVGSSIWDILVRENIQGNDFDDHLNACRELILNIRQRYPNVDLYWKGTSALHPHRVDCNEANYDYQDCLDSTKYLSNSRVVNLEEKQRKLMKELKVPYLDLYPAYYLSAYYTAPGDGRHSVPALNELILNWFYP